MARCPLPDGRALAALNSNAIGCSLGNYDSGPAIEVICRDEIIHTLAIVPKIHPQKNLFPVVYYLKWNSRIIYCKLDIQILTNQRWAGPLPILIIDSNQQSRRLICGERFS